MARVKESGTGFHIVAVLSVVIKGNNQSRHQADGEYKGIFWDDGLFHRF